MQIEKFCLVCGNSNNKQKLFCWPHNREKCNEWLLEMRMPCSILEKHKRICEKHFEDHCFQNHLRLKLNRNAVPTLFPRASKFVRFVSQFESENSDPPHTPDDEPSSSDGTSRSCPSLFIRPDLQSHSIPSYSPDSKSNPGPSSKPDPKSPPSTSNKLKSDSSSLSSSSSPFSKSDTSTKSVPKPKSSPNSSSNPKSSSKSNLVSPLLRPAKRRRYIFKSSSTRKVLNINKRQRREIYALKRMMMNSEFCILPSNCIKFLISRIRYRCNKETGQKWTLNQKLSSLELYKHSPQRYSHLRTFLSLPSKRVLQNIPNDIELSPGISYHLLKQLNKHLGMASGIGRMCTLMFNEMNIQERIQYNSTTNNIEGVEDYGDENLSSQSANNTLVFMAQDVLGKWRLPFAYFFTNGSIRSKELATLIKKVIDALDKANVRVVTTVCDINNVNMDALKMLGASILHPGFIHNSNYISCLFDPPQLLKCTRNLFMAYPIFLSVEISDTCYKREVRWEHLIKAYKVDSQSASRFRLMPRITPSHLIPNQKQRTSLKLATETMSSSVSKALYILAGFKHFHSSLSLYKRSIATAEFIGQVDTCFDSLTGSLENPPVNKPLKGCVSTSSEHFMFWAAAKEQIASWQFAKTDTSNGKPIIWKPLAQTGWLWTIEAMHNICFYLLSEGASKIKAQTFNLEPLENLFESSCIMDSKPTTKEFENLLKIQIINCLSGVSMEGTESAKTNVEFLNNLRNLFN